MPRLPRQRHICIGHRELSHSYGGGPRGESIIVHLGGPGVGIRRHIASKIPGPRLLALFVEAKRWNAIIMPGLVGQKSTLEFGIWNGF